MRARRDRLLGIGLLTVTKALDAAITVWALGSLSRVTEQNWLARQVFDTLGVGGGIVAATGLSLAVAVGGIEASAVLAREADDHAGEVSATATVLSPTAVRAVGYGSLGTFWAVVTVHNLAVVATV